MTKNKMVELEETVCCMCGDVGFPDKLFRCSSCRNRFQHSYCSNYYRGNTEAIEICDWCQCDEKRSLPSRSSHSGEKISRDEGGSATAGKATGKTASSRTATRKYKLLKDVMC